MLRLRACGGTAPASVPTLVRARLSRRASSAASAAATVASASSSSSALEELAAERRGLAKVVLKKGKTQIFRDGSPMVYSGAVDRIIGRPPPKSGDVVLVADGTEKPIGWGLYNSVSMFCVRLMQLEEEARRDPTCTLNMERLLEARISSAVDLRRSLGLPSADTNAYRLINSEGDRLSGLIVDIFADVAVIASSAAWVEKYRQEIQFLVSKVMENGIVYLVSLEGQKTGFYADQRENRSFISLLSKDHCGGFALNAAKGGANNVIGIDSSGLALDLANENIVLNELNHGKISFVKGDATTFMKGAISENELWDLVILDPPKLAPRKKVLQSASGMYRSLNTLAMQVVKPGGLLMTCSCSGAMTQSGMFLKTIQGAASMTGRKVTVLRQAGTACDHPIDPAYPEGQ
ncbi:unnamed protein product [Miscanthus lutarioriparius]|uniref:PUA domain-containing protein n=1 Tax=Miscanthus lutarioriparius TaxID=422564 RepID=A0A811Q6P9_9POAL|nr:unnamed protein product [Miscanthus lutarioriparius]